MNFRQAVATNKKDCLALERIAALAEGTLAEEAAAAARSHIAACLHCDAELTLAERCLTAAARPAEEADTAWIAARLQSRLPFAKPRPWWHCIFDFSSRAPAVLAAACAALLVIAYVGQRPSAPDLDPSAGGVTVMRSGAVELMAPLGDIEAMPAEFEWQTVTGASRYRFELMEVDGNVLLRAETAATRLTLPAAGRRHVVPAKTLLWKVSAFENGKEIATSAPARFRIKP